MVKNVWVGHGCDKARGNEDVALLEVTAQSL